MAGGAGDRWTTLLPGPATRISTDGSRVLLADGTLWDDGTVLTDPGEYSKDLGYRVALIGGTVTVVDVATGASTDAEVGHPRPAGTTGVEPLGVSDDGQTVWYRLAHPTAPIDRHVRVGQATALDLASPSTVEGPDETAMSVAYTVAAGGTALVRETRRTVEYVGPDGSPWTFDLGYTVDKLSVPAGVVTATFSASAEEELPAGLDRTLIADDGTRVWFHTTKMDVREGFCMQYSPTILEPCPLRNDLHVLDGTVYRSWNLTPTGSSSDPAGYRGRWPGYLGGFELSANAKQVVLDHNNGVDTRVSEPAVIYQAVHGEWEVLDRGVERTSSDSVQCWAGPHTDDPCTIRDVPTDAMFSDDLSLIASSTMSGNGWYELARPPAEP